jgi:hypothetical protein
MTLGLHHFQEEMAGTPKKHGRGHNPNHDAADLGASKVHSASRANVGFPSDQFFAAWTFSESHSSDSPNGNAVWFPINLAVPSCTGNLPKSLLQDQI